MYVFLKYTLELIKPELGVEKVKEEKQNKTKYNKYICYGFQPFSFVCIQFL